MVKEFLVPKTRYIVMWSCITYCFEVIGCYLTKTLRFLVLGTCFGDCWWHHSHTSQWIHWSTKPNLFKPQNKTKIL